MIPPLFCARFPKGMAAVREIRVAALRLERKLRTLNVERLNISPFIRRYLSDHIAALGDAIAKAAFLLSWAIATKGKALSDLVFVDYGGGSGIIALLAKECGIGTVIYNDIYDLCCRDARTVAEALGLSADEYVAGDVDDLSGFCRANDLSVDALASYDVIEHIFDIEHFLTALPSLSCEELTCVLASGANYHNPRVRRALMRVHRDFENEHRAPRDGIDPRDSVKPYRDMRADIITTYAPELNNKDLANLARATRGMIVPGIASAVEQYRASGRVPCEIEHPTNTCDPYTGNWCERLMDVRRLRDVLTKAGFGVAVLPGYYGHGANRAKTTIRAALNVAIRLSGESGLAVAPFYVLCATRRTSL